MSESWWFWVLTAGFFLVVAAFAGTFGMYSRLLGHYGQTLAPSLATGMATASGAGIAAEIHRRMVIAHLGPIPVGDRHAEKVDVTILAIAVSAAAAFVLFCELVLPFAAAEATSEQRRIARIRATGTRYAGTLDTVEYRHERVAGMCQFDVTVRFGVYDDLRHVTVRMTTWPTRVPLPGTAVVVIVASPESPGAGPNPVRRRWLRRAAAVNQSILVEPDTAHDIEFDPNVNLYTESSGGGGA
ncbi:hypothetical protein K3888_07185 [Dietzia aurantiaca]|uniref:hypothetical protein n=1 Tax=Dietzia aurantiaca TaxID=983873 RepID=UPI001E4D9E5B|nr:hypothetical protein [Dietzia aurantiaca]MCD2262484.1 hypothetical protein [Dietzia aurantiaca]